MLLLNEFDFYGVRPTENQVNLWVKELQDLSKDEVAFALEILRKDPSRSKPAFPAQIRAAVGGWIGPEQAWSEAPKSEEESSVITDEAAKALSSASEFIREGNMIQARLVFMEVYKNEVSKSLAERKKARWFPSLGAYSTSEEKDRAIMEAVSKKRLSNESALSYRVNLNLETRNNLKLLTSSASEEMNDEQREKNIQRTQDLIAKLNKKNEAKASGGSGC